MLRYVRATVVAVTDGSAACTGNGTLAAGVVTPVPCDDASDIF